jgi:hypothetical protein
MTEKQMEAAQNLLRQPGDRAMASHKMTSLQGMIDPLLKQIPHMPGAIMVGNAATATETIGWEQLGPAVMMENPIKGCCQPKKENTQGTHRLSERTQLDWSPSVLAVTHIRMKLTEVPWIREKL